uniref:Uncharacterized protein n=1 Tax=Solibacter usitatus (strain Ellin6076) TaxID=234267 RepID=Q020R0_SOLUE
MSKFAVRTIAMKYGHFAAQHRHCLLALVLVGLCTSHAVAQESHQHATSEQQTEMTAEQLAKATGLVKIVRDATERYKDVNIAMAAGYTLQFGCVSGESSGAMGLHYVNGSLVNSGVLDATRPQIIIYEPMPDGTLKLIGADFLLMADAWNAKYGAPPQLMGQLFHLFDSPNRFGLPAFYTLHVWAWKDNPNGAFVNWHPNVNCKAFAGGSQ